MAKFEIIRHRKDGAFQFNLRATSGQLLVSSGECGYRTKESCKKGIESVRRNSADRAKTEVVPTYGGGKQFVVKSANGRVIASSQPHIDDNSLQATLRAVRNTSHQAAIVDLSKK